MSLISGSSGDKVRKSQKPCCKRFMDEELDDVKSLAFWRAVVAEFLASVFLVITGVGCGLHEHGTSHPGSVHVVLHAGFYFAAMITVLDNISGGHINPAVSIGFLVTRNISVLRFIVYVIAQSAGGVVGAVAIKYLVPDSLIGDVGLLLPAKGVTDEQALVVEMIISFLLVFTIFGVIDKGRTDIKGSKPMIIGFVIAANLFFGSRISGGCMNPIRNLGPAAITGKMERQWIYWVGDLVGGALGALTWHHVFSVAAADRGLSGCLSKRKYSAVKASEAGTEKIDSSEFSEELPRKGSYRSLDDMKHQV